MVSSCCGDTIYLDMDGVRWCLITPDVVHPEYTRRILHARCRSCNEFMVQLHLIVIPR